MDFLNSIIEGIKNNLKWKAQSAAAGGLETGIGSVIKKFKGGNKCPSCKKPIAEENAKFCPNCRAKLILKCSKPDCGRESKLGTQFCPSCGTDLSKE
ncbi:MAG: zinc ribbon domain-containing protein [Candidatus Pacebacteria bacterium]|nr:zinc ribbon domain-containing protein [Candidatus Paceibacterota bacterium]